jgi:exopolysaccharide biosynthesis protein
MFDTDIHIYKTNSKEDVDVTLGVRRKLEKLSKIFDPKRKVVAKTNCGFFSSKNEHLGLYVDEGLYYTPSGSSFIDFIYYKDGHTEIRFIKDTKEISYLQPRTKWAIGTSWSLVVNGEINIINEEKLDHSKYANPRTMLGQKKDHTFLSVVTEGRSSTNVGLKCTEEAELMKLLGAWNAVNLDGGGSTEMIVDNKIMNTPTDSGKERSIGSAILIYKK